MNGSGYSAGLALRHLVQGPRRPRDVMREALEAGIGEPWRLVLFVLSSAVVMLIDPAEDSTLRAVAAELAVLGSATAILARLALYGGFFVGGAALLYGVVSLGVWCFARPTAERPSFATVRSVVAVASWVAMLPSLAVSLVAEWGGASWAGAVLTFGLSVAYIGIGLSEATGIDSRKATAFATAGSILSLALAVGLVLGLAFGPFGDLLGGFLSRDAP